MIFNETILKGSYVIELKPFTDERGWFARTFCKDEFKKNYGNVSPATTSTILRKVIELEGQGADTFFGEKSFEVDDLMRISNDGRGVISILRVTDLQDRPTNSP